MRSHRDAPARPPPDGESRASGVRWLVASLAGLVSACASQMVCPPDDAMQCRTTGGPTEAVVTGAAAATLWVTAGGCKIAGCNAPYICNPETELCEPLRCNEGQSCPPPYECDLERHRCF